MNISMSYIDYNLADVSQREIFSFTKAYMSELYKKLYKNPHIYGVVIISTCNRTEIYLSLDDDVDYIPFEKLCCAMDIDFNDYISLNKTIYGNDVLIHLCELACGVKSQIWGEDQIISQVKDSIAFAREVGTTDSILEVVFRTAISAAKKVKTLVDFKTDDNSTAKSAVNIILKNKNISNVLVIGNGMIGVMVTKLLLKNNISATMTLRHYRHGKNTIPDGADTVDYYSRYNAMENCDAVISATLSPHHTVKYNELINLNHIPKIFIDLAVPRDIDSKIRKIEGVECFNIDEIGCDTIKKSHKEQMKQVETIISKYINDFYKWYNYKIQKELVKV